VREPSEWFWLLPPLLAGLPHAAYLPVWLSAACAGAWLWRMGLAWRRSPLPPRWLRVLLAMAAVVAVLSQFGLIIGRQSGVPLLLLLSFVKLLETESVRERRLVLLLSYFVALSYFLFDQSLPLTLYMVGTALLITTALAMLQPLPSAGIRRGLKTAVGLFLGGLPLALALFLFFPRLDRPLWLLPNAEKAGRTGLSDTMAPGDFGQLILSGDVAFRASFTGPAPDPAGLYWRGPVLTRFDGRSWHAVAQPQAPASAEPQGEALHYTLTLEPEERNWIFTLGLPSPLPYRTRLLGDMQLVAPRAITQRTRFELTSYPRYRLGADPLELDRALQLPKGFDPRARSLAEKWRAQTGDPRRIVDLALAFYRSSFTYTLLPPALGLHSVDEFLFDTQRGFCEHFAGSFVFLMRAAGIPARVVTGYLGGEANPIDGHIVVRQSDAHAWAEVWYPDTGWTQVDPTAAVSPARVEVGIAAALPAMELPAALARMRTPWLRHLEDAWEALNNGWNQWVLGYDMDSQLALLARLSPALMHRAWLAAVATLLSGLLVMGLLAWWSGRNPDLDAPTRHYARFLGRMARLGIRRSASEGALDFAARATAMRPDLEQDIGHISRLYVRARYVPDPAALKELAARVRLFRPRLRPPRYGLVKRELGT
jgi:protein-glutamine gamma-glutamyltransferase